MMVTNLVREHEPLLLRVEQARALPI